MAILSDAPNRKWAGDITYVWTSEGWLYLAVILDLPFDCLLAACAQDKLRRRVVGWAVSDRMKKDLAIRALDRAVRLRQPILFLRLSEKAAGLWSASIDEREG